MPEKETIFGDPVYSVGPTELNDARTITQYGVRSAIEQYEMPVLNVQRCSVILRFSCHSSTGHLSPNDTRLGLFPITVNMRLRSGPWAEERMCFLFLLFLRSRFLS